MKCRAAVTFEYATRAPQTHRIDALEATGPQTIAARAIREAKRHVRPVYWTSVICLIERLDATGAEAAIAEVEEAAEAAEVEASETEDATEETETA